MPTPLQARVNPPTNVPGDRQRRTNRALSQGLDALPFFPISEYIVRTPATTSVTATSPTVLAINSVNVEVDIDKTEVWTDLVIDYLGSMFAPTAAIPVHFTFDLIERESGAIILGSSPLGRSVAGLNTHSLAWGHSRLHNIAPGGYTVRLKWHLNAAGTARLDSNDQQLLTVVEALPRPQPTFVEPED